jgi:hypothetical protein
MKWSELPLPIAIALLLMFGGVRATLEGFESAGFFLGLGACLLGIWVGLRKTKKDDDP